MTTATRDIILPAEWRDFWALTKPRVMSLVVFTALCGLLAAPGSIHPVIGFTAILCLALGAGACGALNQYFEADIDAKMARTAGRPLPAGRMDRASALNFGIGLAAFSVGIMGGCGQLAMCWPACLFDLLLRDCLHYLVEAQHAAEYRYRRCCGCISACNRMGGGNRRRYAYASPPVRDHLPLDTAAFLGARLVYEDGLRRGRNSHAPQCERSAGHT